MAVRETIKGRLEKLEPRASAAIALRAAMRVLPVLALRKKLENQSFAYWPMPDRSGYALNIFRCYQISSFIGSEPTFNFGEVATVTNLARRAVEIVEGAAMSAHSISVAASATCLAAGDAMRFADATILTTDVRNELCERVMNAATLALADADLSSDDAVSAIHIDLHAAQNTYAFNAVTAGPLWPSGIPDNIYDFWRLLQTDLSKLRDGFHVWIDWYRDRLRGNRANLELERKWALLPDELLRQTPAEINAHLEHLAVDDGVVLTRDEPDEVFRDLPGEQQPGLQFATAPDGRIDLKPSGIASPDDLARISEKRTIIVEALDDLVTDLEGSNAYKSISRIAIKYKATITADAPSLWHSFGKQPCAD